MVDRIGQELGQNGEDHVRVMSQVLDVGEYSHERRQWVHSMQRLGFKCELNMPITGRGVGIRP